MKNWWGALFFVFIGASAYAIPASPDSLSENNKIKLVFNFDNRASFVRQESVTIYGAKVGLDFFKRVRTGLGIYAMLRPEDYNISILHDKIVEINVNSRLRFWYVAGYGEYVLLNKKKWELSAPVQLGVGRTSVQLFGSGSTDIPVTSRNYKTVFVLEPTLTGHYKFFQWVGVGAGVGYRHMLFADNATMNRSFNRPIYIVKLKLFLGHLIRAAKGEQPFFE